MLTSKTKTLRNLELFERTLIKTIAENEADIKTFGGKYKRVAQKFISIIKWIYMN